MKCRHLIKIGIMPVIKIGIMPVIIALCAIFLTDVARADSMFVQFSSSTQETLINCCMILAAGMIVSALILKKWK